ncbi:lantibiotic dehydratase [Nonomuraea typhae]|uniref:Lantibiotic dehydratase n=1 Tax=Nonomuraea typhae TaxID=2603600 RepID=A0ABW7YSY0_9ACTN
MDDLTPTFAVRRANLPASAIESLRFTRTAALIKEIIAADTWLEHEGRRISDELYDILADVTEPGLKPLLVGLRRATYAGRRPTGKTFGDRVQAALPEEVRLRVRTWQERLAVRRKAVDDLPAVLEEERQAKLAELLRQAGHDAFRFGLVQGSPTLSARLTEWRAAPPGTQPERKVALRLAKYLARVTAKASPYSTFTATGVGSWNRPDGGWRWSSRLELNCWLAGRLTRALVRRPEPAMRLPVRVNPSAVERDGRVLFLSRKDVEGLASVVVNPALRGCLDHLRDTPGASLADLRDEIERRSGGRRDRVTGYLLQLVDLGLVELCSPVPDQSTDPLLDLAAWLDGEPGEACHDLPDRLRDLRRSLHAYPGLESAEDRAHELESIRSGLAEVFTGAGLDADSLPVKNLVHETAVLDTLAPATREEVTCILPELASIRSFTAIFHPDLPLKLACAHLFRRLVPAGGAMPLMDFYRHVRERIDSGGDAELRAHLNDPFPSYWPLETSAVPAVAALADLREHARADLDAALTGDALARHVDTTVLDRIAASWPAHVRPADSVAFYLQFLPGDGPRAVMNECTIGYGRGQRRIAGSTTAADGRPLYRHPEVTLAECDALLGSCLNLRAPATRAVIDYPAQFSTREGAWRIPLNACRVELDEETGLLILGSSGWSARIRPLHLGLLGELWLPPALRFLVKAFGEPPQLIYQVWSPFFDLERCSRDLGRVKVVRVPRVCVGRVVTVRRTHFVHAADMPQRTKGEADWSYLLRLRAWLEEHDIPHRSYVRVLDRETREGKGDPLMKVRKPMYVDADNWFLVASLERTIRRPDDLVVFQESLPDLTDAPAYGTGRHVTEHVVELSHRLSLD